MPARPIDGKAVAQKLSQETAKLLAGLDFRPGLAAVLVGDDPASHLYVSLKEKACAKLGVGFRKTLLPAATDEKRVLAAVAELNRDQNVDGIIVQLPLPAGLDEDAVIAAIDPAKDADGFHPDNRVAVLEGRERIVPGLVAGIMELINSTGVSVKGRTAAAVVNSPVFFEPLKEILTRAGVRHTEWLKSGSRQLRDQCRGADIVIVAVGRPGLVTGPMLKPGAIVIDVGTNRVDGKLAGDVEASSAKEVAGWLTPVPGGVGPVTVAMLVRNTVELASKRRGR